MSAVADLLPGTGPVLLLADHAGRAVPDDVALGVDGADVARHNACDLGADALTRPLAKRLDARAELGCWSRLVADFNRRADDPAAVPVVDDVTPISAKVAQNGNAVLRGLPAITSSTVAWWGTCSRSAAPV